MKKKLVLLASYFGIVPVFICALILLSLYNLHTNSSFSEKHNVFSKKIEFKALPAEVVESSVEVTEEDARIKVLHEFFTKYNSPLVPYAKTVVETADKYGIDYRLVPSIAMQESNLCKKIPKNSFNCWGYGIYGGKVTRFSDYNEAIETITKGLAKNYKNQGLSHPEDIMTKYTPGSNGSWATSVIYFMDKLESSL